jgi:hypothetical protein
MAMRFEDLITRVADGHYNAELIVDDIDIDDFVVETTEAVRVLDECAELQIRKALDYQSAGSSVVQADHYRRGIDSIHDMIAQKLLRAQSVLESGDDPANESLEDTYKDLINYASFAVAWLRGGIPGQDINRGAFNERQ